MAIVPSKLISAPMLQDYLVDKDDGQPLIAGTITCYQDNSRTVLKNWYYQTGAPGNYTYTQLPNPLILSAAGTICDANGNDTIPFFYPYSESDSNTIEKYYITVDDSNSERQFVRQNFPQIIGGSTGTSSGDLRNLIVNNRFWRNYGSIGLNLGNITQTVVCPSQHDGFEFPDFQFFKSNVGATEVLTFLSFPSGSNFITDDIQPEFYMNHNCSVNGSESSKYYLFPISLHIDILATQTATFTIQAINTGGGVQNNIEIELLQSWGTNASTPAAFPIGTINTTANWKKSVFQFTFPSSVGAVLSPTGDDAYYIKLKLPAGQNFNMSWCLPSVYLVEEQSIPLKDFATYDQIDAVIGTPRTGDYRTSLNNFYYFGWVPANNGEIGSSSSGATTRANNDTWQLYNLIWNNILNNWAPVSGGRGISAYADFTANKTLTLTKTLGRFLSGQAMTAETMTVTNSNYPISRFNLTVASSSSFNQGDPVQLTNITGFTGVFINNVYFVIIISPTVIQLANSIGDTEGTPIPLDLGAAGNATIQNALGGIDGTSSQTLLTGNLPPLPPFSADITLTTPNPTGGSGGPLNAVGAGAGTSAVTITPTSTPTPSSFRIVNPQTFVNVYIKL